MTLAVSATGKYRPIDMHRDLQIPTEPAKENNE